MITYTLTSGRNYEKITRDYLSAKLPEGRTMHDPVDIITFSTLKSILKLTRLVIKCHFIPKKDILIYYNNIISK